MQHFDILKMVETRAHEKDRNRLTRAKARMQFNWWSADTRLEDRPDDEALLAEKERLQSAIDKIDGLLREGGFALKKAKIWAAGWICG